MIRKELEYVDHTVCVFYETNNEFKTFIVVLEKNAIHRTICFEKKIIGLENQSDISLLCKKNWYTQ